MEQLRFSVGDQTRTLLQDLAEEAGTSLSEMIRYHVERSLNLGNEGNTAALLDTINRLASLTKAQTGEYWFFHPGAAGLFMTAVVLAIQRAAGGPMGTSLEIEYYKPSFDPSKLPEARPVSWADQSGWAVQLEAIEFYGRQK